MKLSGAPSKIVGVQLGKVSVELIRETAVGITAKFALLSKEGEILGFVDIPGGWSEKLEAALTTFVDALEEEALRVIFEQQSSETPQSSPQNEPQQF